MFSKAKQLASIAAAGASAIVLTGGKAEATNIISSVLLNQVLGFTSNLNPTGNNVVASDLFNTFGSGPAIRFQAISNRSSTSSYLRKISMSRGGARNTTFGIHAGGGLPNFAFGAAWGAATEHGANLGVESRRFGSFAGIGRPAFTDQYFLFRFNGNSGTDYGWIEASVSVTASRSSLASFGPTLTIIQYAFDTTGVQITAGQLPAPAPEPSTIAESGLAALILGAEGLRRWRKVRKAA
jgi:hypothetical protein